MSNLSTLHREMDDYRSDEELFVYDQNCKNCRYCSSYGEYNGQELIACQKNQGSDYREAPASNWCVDWKGKGSRL